MAKKVRKKMVENKKWRIQKKHTHTVCIKKNSSTVIFIYLNFFAMKQKTVSTTNKKCPRSFLGTPPPSLLPHFFPAPETKIRQQQKHLFKEPSEQDAHTAVLRVS
eukprot:GEMP01057731.1.p2 GENE.GEMP01057731.1~~GEMP01057731.1.p2  ORF type:complete len:105 (-),score=9.81 GEMP01057731.1:131-445(-)